MYEIINNEILSYFPSTLSEIKVFSKNLWDIAEEIRIRVGQPICIKIHSGDIFLNKIINSEDILKLLENFSDNSIYSVQADINNGYITIKGGHRIGISGTSIMDNERIININYISSLNIRIARQVKDCSSKLLKYVIRENEFKNTIVISPPRMW